jgi:type II secretory ATPase GspE/PulE/Tfp pilus assembly ATPase PilB-like protein
MTDLSDQRNLAPQPAQPSAGGAVALAELARIDSPAQLVDAIDQQARRPPVRIGEALLALGLIDERALGDALQLQTQDRTRPLGELLVQRGLVSRSDLQAALAHRMGFPIVDAASFPVEPAALDRIPEALARRLPALPLLLRGDRLVVALEDPSARIVVDELEAVANCSIVPVLAWAGSLGPALDRLYAAAHRGGVPADALAPPTRSTPPQEAPPGAATLPAGAQRPGVTPDTALQPGAEPPLESLLREAHAAGATALHLECPEPHQPVRLHQRRGGRLQAAGELPAHWREPLTTRLKTLAGLDTAEQRRPQSGRVDLPGLAGGQVLRLQVTTLPTADGMEDLVLRLSTPPAARPLQALGLPAPVLARMIAALQAPHGLLLCAGLRGSGLTTLLHAALAHLNTAERRLWTVEPALEIRQPGLRQLQLNPRVAHGAGRALRALQEADADVVMVDAPADADALREAIALAQAGPLVLVAVQAADAARARAQLVAAGADAAVLQRVLRGTLVLAAGQPAAFSDGEAAASAS